jgi:rhodanese-related sulfurtransferase
MMNFISPEDAKVRLAAGAIPVDIRSQSEYAESHIPGALMLPLDGLDQEAARAVGDHEVIFYCASDRRTQATMPAIKQAGFTRAACLQGGIDAWRAAGLPVQGSGAASTTISIMRQVQITVGVCLITLTVLSAIVSPMYVFGAGAIGLGLLFAGLTGSCAMASILLRMPWNRVTIEAKPTDVSAASAA